MKVDDPQSGRLMSIDALRGWDMAFISGLGGLVAALGVAIPGCTWLRDQMGHVQWFGLHFIDTVYPLFLFVAGLSFPFSYAKQKERGISSAGVHLKLFKRMLALIFLGWVYQGFFKFDFANFRYASVLGRIGVSWFFAALLFVHFNWRARAVISAAFLTGYWLIICNVTAPDAPAGCGPLSLEGNFAGYCDRLFMPGSLWEKDAAGKEWMEPSGTLENLPSIVTAMLGMFCGEFVRWRSDAVSPKRKVALMFAAAAAMTALGLVWAYDFPICKKLWSSSYVLVVGGYSVAMFALFYWLIDVKGWRKWCFPLRVIGMNAITVYLLQAIVPIWSVTVFFFGGLQRLAGKPWGDVIANAGYFSICWIILYYFYRKKTFLKI